MMLIVSNDTRDRTTADSVRPSSENKHTTVKSSQMGGESLIGKVCARVIDIALPLSMSN
jgi:hypothetical protein